jgi:hypothetical protein
MEVLLRCMDPAHSGEIWSLDLGDESIELKDESDEMVAQFPAAEAPERFQMPSFTRRVRYFGISLDDDLHQFKPDNEAMAAIKKTLNKALVNAGSEKINSIRASATRETLAGLGLLGAAVIVVLLSQGGARNRPFAGVGRILMGLLLFGSASLCRGLYGFWHHRKLVEMADPFYRDEETR